MKPHKVYIYERLVHSIEIEADSRSEAIDKAYDLLKNGTTKELNECNYSYEGKFTDDEVLDVVQIGEK